MLLGLPDEREATRAKRISVSKSTLFSKIFEGLFENSDVIQIKISAAISRAISANDGFQHWVNENSLFILFIIFSALIYLSIYIIYRICKNSYKRKILLCFFVIFGFGVVFYDLSIILLSFFFYIVLNKIRIMNDKLDKIAEEVGVNISLRDLDGRRGK